MTRDVTGREYCKLVIVISKVSIYNYTINLNYTITPERILTLTMNPA